MASSTETSSQPHRPARPNLAFRQARGQRSPAEFAALVRRAAREIGEQVSCDARYIGRVEAGEIRCPNYAYERVFLHMFPGRTLTDLGFAPRSSVRGRPARPPGQSPVLGGDETQGAYDPYDTRNPGTHPGLPDPEDPHDPQDPPDPYDLHAPYEPYDHPAPQDPYDPHQHPHEQYPYAPLAPYGTPQSDEESDVLRRAFMTGGGATMAAALAPLGLGLGPSGLTAGATDTDGAGTAARPLRPGTSEAAAVEEAVRRIRLLDDRHGADGLYRRAAAPLRAAYALLDAGATRRTTADRLHSGTGELAISVGWLAHDSGRFEDARSHYAEALATARMTGDDALEAHAFCNTAFLARDAGRPREAVRAAQAAQRIARPLGSPRLLSLLALREAGGWAGLADRTACEQALTRAKALFERGCSDADPEWMSFYGEAELAGLEGQCWATLGDWPRAARHARRAAVLQDPHFARNTALYTAQLADDLARAGRPDEAAAAGLRVLALMDQVESSRILTMLAGTARVLLPHRRASGVPEFLQRHAALRREA